MPDQFRYRGSRPPQARTTPLLVARNTVSLTRDAASEDAAPVSDVATMRLYDVIDSWGGEWGISAREIADALDSVPDVKEINLHINSPGGDAFEGIAILNLLRQHPANVTAYVDGIAASAASFIAT